MSRSGYRPDRLARAWQLVKSGRVQRLGGGRFMVAGNVEETYAVDLTVDPPCYCRDQEYRGGQIKQNCKHALAARLANLDPAVLAAIADSIERQMQQAREGRRTRRRRADRLTTTEER